MAYEYVNETGTIVADTQESRAKIEAEYKAIFGEDLVTNNGSTASILITADTIADKKQQEITAYTLNQFNPDLAGGVALDNIGALTNAQRRKATSTVVLAILSGVIGTLIPKNSVAETLENNRFLLTQDVIIQSDGTVEAVFESEEKGAIPCPANSLINIADGGVLGWETIINPNAGVLGLDTQDDTVFKIDRKLTLAKGAKGIPFSITSGLYGIDEIKSLQFLENYTNTVKVEENVTMEPHSIYLCIDGGNNEDIANILYSYKTLGCGYNNGASSKPETVTITALDTNRPYTVLFDRPDEVIILIKIKVKAMASAINQTEAIRNSILKYVNSDIRTDGFKVGVSISPYEIVAEVANDTNFYVFDCEVAKQSDSVFTRETIPIEVWEKGLTESNLIEVTLV